jgi:hypothetical protein
MQVNDIASVVALLYGLATLFAHVLPPNWAFTRACARVGAALAGWRVTPAPAPKAPSVPPALCLALLAFATQGCTWSLAAARAQRAPSASAATASAEPPPECDVIDREHSIATTLAGVFGAVAGAQGVTAIPVRDERAREGLLIGATASGVGAAVAGIWAQDRAERYQRRCAP